MLGLPVNSSAPPFPLISALISRRRLFNSLTVALALLIALAFLQRAVAPLLPP